MALLGYWSFDAGTSHDDTGNGNNGTDTSMAYGAPAYLGANAAIFSGGQVAIPNIALGAGAWTLRCCSRTTVDPAGGYRCMVAIPAGVGGLYLRRVGTPAFSFYMGGDHTFGTLSALNTYAEVVIAQDSPSGDLRCYVDGVLVQTYAGLGASFTIGRFGFDGGNAWLGPQDEIGVWNRALSGSEIAAMVGKTRIDPGFPDGPTPPGPQVVLVSPPQGVISAATPLVVDVTDTIALRRVLLVARFASFWELIHDGDRFSPAYSEATRTPITNGYRYQLKRQPSWPSGPLPLEVFAFDDNGFEA